MYQLFLIFFRLSPYEGRQHIHYIPQDTKLLAFRDFQADKVANVLPHAGVATEALEGNADLFVVGGGRQRSEEEHDHCGMSLSHLFCPSNKFIA